MISNHSNITVENKTYSQRNGNNPFDMLKNHTRL